MVTDDTSVQSVSEIERGCPLPPAPPPFVVLTNEEPMLLTAGPGHGISPSHRWLSKDPGRGISLTVVLTMCVAKKDLFL